MWHPISKSEEVFVLYLIAQQVGDDKGVVTGRNSIAKAPPLVVVYAERADILTNHTATYKVSLAVMVKSNIDDTDFDTHDQLVSKTFGFLRVDNPGAENCPVLCQALNSMNVQDFTVQAVREVGLESHASESGDVWIDTMNIEVICSPSVIT